MVYGTRRTSRQYYYDLTISQRHITVYLNGKTEPCYWIESIKDGATFAFSFSDCYRLAEIVPSLTYE
ncbi:hypothetical protein [Vibrio owensii]|uniref:hypothetical protein n=1 Tax=Vibrio owensii TaxID=696485 RepID=UPI000A622078|nr:hypothetical protein [Vibrio owensii]